MRLISGVGIIVICPDILNLYRVLATFFLGADFRRDVSFFE